MVSKMLLEVGAGAEEKLAFQAIDVDAVAARIAWAALDG